MKNVILIDEEYGYRNWILIVGDAELEEIKRRWATMRGLTCLVPVTMIFPHAKRCTVEDWLEWSDSEMPQAKRDELEREARVFRAHVHESDDSSFDALPEFKIPEARGFEIDGKAWRDDELYALNREREKERT
jgi:hypothetical protein